MKSLLVKYADGSTSRWSAKEYKLGTVRWSISKYGKDGYYLAGQSHAGEMPIEDYRKNVEALKDLQSNNNFVVVEC